MTDTPETDNNCYAATTLAMGRPIPDVVHADFARRLERERDEARRIVEKESEASPEAPCPVPTPLRVRERGSDAWVEDARGRAVIERTQGLSEEEHEAFLAWVVARANDH